MISRDVTIVNDVGLHARPATFFIQKANSYKASLWIEKDDRRVNAKSLLGVLSMGIVKGTVVTIIADGEEEAVAAAEGMAKEAGAKRCMPLKVSGPFHTKFMQPAGDALEQKFKEISFGNMQVPVIFNTVAEELPKDKTIQELLVKQVQSSIYMEDTIKLLEARGVDTIVEIGPGKVLSGFVKRTAEGMTSYAVEDMEGLQTMLTAVKGK